MKVIEDRRYLYIPIVTDELVPTILNIVRRNAAGSFLVEPGDRPGEWRIYVEEHRGERRYAANVVI